MREVERTALVPYTAAQMYAIVDDIVRYPEFVPWCRAASERERTAGAVTGTLEISRGSFHARLTTRNTLEPPRRIMLRQTEGPLRSLEGGWSFTSIPEEGPAQGSKVGLRLRFEFKNPAFGILFGSKFESLWDGLVDAFVERARALYGTTRA